MEKIFSIFSYFFANIEIAILLISVVTAIFLIIWISGSAKRKEKNALLIMKTRYEKGEIDAKEYQEMKRNIIES